MVTILAGPFAYAAVAAIIETGGTKVDSTGTVCYAVLCGVMLCYAML